MNYSQMYETALKYGLLREVLESYSYLERTNPNDPDNCVHALEEWDLL